jgi:hypothetical protein
MTRTQKGKLMNRKLRALVGPALVVVGVLVGPGGWLAVVLYGLAVIMWGTAAAGSCPVSSLFALRTCPLQRAKPPGSEHVSTHRVRP